MSHRELGPWASRRFFLRSGAGVVVVLGAGMSVPALPAAPDVKAKLTPGRFRRPEHGMLTLLGNPTEGASIDLAEHARAWSKAVADFAAQGVHLFFPHIPLTDCWRGENRYDFAPLEAVIRRTLANDPQASLILRLRLNTPDWWLERHPGEVLRYGDGTDSVQVDWGYEVKTASLASMRWRRDVEGLLRAVVGHVQRSDYAGRIVGYHPALMNGGEWFQEGAAKKADYSPVMQAAFREWLQGKYPREAFPKHPIPTPAERNTGDIGHLRDPAKSRRILDYYEFYHRQFAEQAEDYCRIVKEATAGEAITGIYYGYSIISALVPHIQGFGHLALKHVLDSPHIDYISSMLDNEYRGEEALGWSFGPLADSARAHGKVYMAEDEARAWLKPRVPKESPFPGARTLPEEINDLKRNFACALTHGAHEELADLGGGWYGDPQIMDGIGQLAKMAADSTWSRTPVSEIALFIDERGFFYQDESHGALNRALINESMPEYFHIGAPLDLYLFSDLTDGRIPLSRYKLIVLLNPWHLTDRQRAFIKERVQCEGRWMLTFYAAGFFGESEPGTQAMGDLTGIEVRMDTKPGSLTLASRGRTYGTKQDVAPVFFSTDAGAEVWAHQSDGNRSAVSVKRLPGWTSVYAAVPVLPAQLLRRMASAAGVHLYVESDDLIYATQGFLAIRAGEEGVKRLRLPRIGDLYDPYERKTDARSVREFALPMKKGDTKIWRIVWSIPR